MFNRLLKIRSYISLHISNIPVHLVRCFFNRPISFFIAAAGFKRATDDPHFNTVGVLLNSTGSDTFSFYIHYFNDFIVPNKLYIFVSTSIDQVFSAYRLDFIYFFGIFTFLFFFIRYTSDRSTVDTHDGVWHAVKHGGELLTIWCLGILYHSGLKLSKLKEETIYKYQNMLKTNMNYFVKEGIGVNFNFNEEFFVELVEKNGTNYTIANIYSNGMVIDDHYGIFMKCVMAFMGALFFYSVSRYIRVHNFIRFVNSGESDFPRRFDKANRFYLNFFLISSLALFFLSILISSYDLLALFVALEGATLCLYILAGLRADKKLSVEAGVKYFLTSAVFSCIFGLGLFLIYFATGSTNFGEIREVLLTLSEQAYSPSVGYFTYYNNIDTVAFLGVFLVIVVFLMKLGSVPFHFWIGDVYQGSPLIVTAFFATVVRVAFFAIFFRLVVYTFAFVKPFLIPILFYSGSAAIVFGSIFTLFQFELKRFLANSSIVHTGFILLGLSCMTLDGFKSSVLYTVVYIFTLLCFLVVILLYPVNTDSGDISQVSVFSHLQRLPFLIKLVFTFLLFSMAGLPPFPGFIIKLYTLKAVFEGLIFDKLRYLSFYGDYSIFFNFGTNFIFFIVILVSLLTAFNYTRLIISMMFGKDALNEVELDSFVYNKSLQRIPKFLYGIFKYAHFVVVLVLVALHFILIKDLSSFYSGNTFDSIISSCYHTAFNQEFVNVFGENIDSILLLDDKKPSEVLGFWRSARRNYITIAEVQQLKMRDVTFVNKDGRSVWTLPLNSLEKK